MKKMIVFAATLFVCVAAFSQDSSSTRPLGGDSSAMRPMSGDTMGNKMNQKMTGKMKDCVMMHAGTLMVMKGGQNSALSQQMTFPNGTAIAPDGTVTMKDGSSKMLKEGECIYMDGSMGKMPMGNKMKMKKDSSMM